MSERLVTALRQMRIHRPTDASEPENLAGFSTKYRSEAARREAQQSQLTIFTRFVGSWVR